MLKKYWIIFSWICLACFVYVRYLVWLHFSNVFVDSDQTINWLTAVDLSNGKFYSPYFYGQFYNNILEAVCAAPWIKLGLPVEQVMPIVVTVLGSVPFLIAFHIFYKRSRYGLAAIAMVVALAMPAEYQLITATARGFMGGLVAASLGIWLLVTSNKVAPFVGLFSCLFSVLLNPNSLIVLIPVGLYQFTINSHHVRKHWQLYGVAVFIFLFALYKLKLFQVVYAHYEVHKLWTLRFETDFFIHALKNGDERWCYTVPFLYKNGGILAVILVLVVPLFVWKFKWTKPTWIVSSFLAFFVFTLFLNKTLDGTTNVFFPYTRMYLGIPLVFIFFLWLSDIKLQTRWSLGVVVAALLVGMIQQHNRIPETSLVAVRKNPGNVQVQRIKQLCKSCDEIKELVDKTQSEILVLHSKSDEYTYGCKALIPGLETVHPQYERRYWEWEKHALDTVYSRIMFFDWNLRLDQEIIPESGELSALKNVQFPAYLLQNNTDRLVDIYPYELQAKRRYIDK